MKRIRTAPIPLAGALLAAAVRAHAGPLDLCVTPSLDPIKASVPGSCSFSDWNRQTPQDKLKQLDPGGGAIEAGLAAAGGPCSSPSDPACQPPQDSKEIPLPAGAYRAYNTFVGTQLCFKGDSCYPEALCKEMPNCQNALKVAQAAQDKAASEAQAKKEKDNTAYGWNPTGLPTGANDKNKRTYPSSSRGAGNNPGINSQDGSPSVGQSGEDPGFRALMDADIDNGAYGLAEGQERPGGLLAASGGQGADNNPAFGNRPRRAAPARPDQPPVSGATVAGDLTVSPNIERPLGSFKTLGAGLDQTLENVIEPGTDDYNRATKTKSDNLGPAAVRDPSRVYANDGK